MCNRFWPIRLSAFTLLFTVLWLGQITSAYAHRVTVFAWTEGDRIHTESKFANGKPVNGGKIVVLDSSGEELLTGTTDQTGGFSFGMPKSPPLKIELFAGMGHKAFWIVEAGDENNHTTGVSPKTISVRPETDLADDTETATLTAKEVEMIVAKALDQKLAPIHMAIARQEQKQQNKTRDIFAGIGYILGLVGVGAYVHYRKKAS
jgi:nickel transport protein